MGLIECVAKRFNGAWRLAIGEICNRNVFKQQQAEIKRARERERERRRELWLDMDPNDR